MRTSTYPLHMGGHSSISEVRCNYALLLRTVGVEDTRPQQGVHLFLEELA